VRLPRSEDALEQDVSRVLRDPADRLRAISLATSNVHAPAQQALAALGPVMVLTDDDIGDVSCIYQVDGPDDQYATVFVSPVLPYAAVILGQAKSYVRFASTGETGWVGRVVDCLTGRGLAVLPEITCRARAAQPLWSDGPPTSWFEYLFQDEFGLPGDWSWADDGDHEQEGG
jgi:hypothetical protein